MWNEQTPSVMSLPDSFSGEKKNESVDTVTVAETILEMQNQYQPVAIKDDSPEQINIGLVTLFPATAEYTPISTKFDRTEDNAETNVTDTTAYVTPDETPNATLHDDQLSVRMPSPTLVSRISPRMSPKIHKYFKSPLRSRNVSPNSPTAADTSTATISADTTEVAVQVEHTSSDAEAQCNVETVRKLSRSSA